MEQLGARAAQTRRRIRSSSSKVISLGYHLCDAAVLYATPVGCARGIMVGFDRPPDGFKQATPD